jgi:hypothetical protein
MVVWAELALIPTHPESLWFEDDEKAGEVDRVRTVRLAKSLFPENLLFSYLTYDIYLRGKTHVTRTPVSNSVTRIARLVTASC